MRTLLAALAALGAPFCCAAGHDAQTAAAAPQWCGSPATWLNDTALSNPQHHLGRWMAAVGGRWESLIRSAYLDFDDADLEQFKTWLACSDGIHQMH